MSIYALQPFSYLALSCTKRIELKRILVTNKSHIPISMFLYYSHDRSWPA